MRFLLTGGRGRLGTELQKDICLMDQCWAPTREELDIVNMGSDGRGVESWYKNNWHKYCDVVRIIHCAAYTDVPGAETNRREVIESNIIGSKNIAFLGQITGLSVVYISTDYVYPGTDGNYSETDKVDPLNFYAFTKLAGEAFMDPDKDLIIRTSFKPITPWPYPKAFDDLYSSADYVDVVAKKIAFLIAHCWDDTGIINVGTERKSIYDLARRRNRDVKPMSKKEITDVKLPSDISMNLEKYNKIYEATVGD